MKRLIKQIKIDIPGLGETIMTYAEKLREESEQKGRMEGMKECIKEGLQLGKQEGMQLGKQEAQIEMAKQLLRLGVDESIIIRTTHTHLSAAQLKNLH